MEFLRTGLSYIRRHIRAIILVIAFFAIFGVVFSFYELPMEPIFYALVLCFFCAGIVTVIDFCRFYARHRRLQNLMGEINLQITGLPAPQGAIERDYDALIRELFAEKTRIITRNARDSSDMIDYYTTWVHQVKTPIAAMRLVLKSSTGESQDENLTQLFKIEQYVEIVLQYLRIHEDGTDFVFAECSLDKIVNFAVQKYARLFIKSRISLDFQPLNCEALTDEKWLTFVVEQILSNAIKYAPAGNVSIYMAENCEKTLVIEDNGIGIKAEDLPRIFDNGFTGYNGRADMRATGIGLYLCKKILTKLGHAIKIESEGGKTRVLISLESYLTKM